MAAEEDDMEAGQEETNIIFVLETYLRWSFAKPSLHSLPVCQTSK